MLHTSMKEQLCYHGYLWQNRKKVIKSAVGLSFSRKSRPSQATRHLTVLYQQLILFPPSFYVHTYRVEWRGRYWCIKGVNYAWWCWVSLRKLVKFCNLRNYFLILLLLCLFFFCCFGWGVRGIERPTAKSWFHLKGFTMLAWENISTGGLVAPVQVVCSAVAISPRHHIIILCIISPSWSELIEQLGTFSCLPTLLL